MTMSPVSVRTTLTAVCPLVPTTSPILVITTNPVRPWVFGKNTADFDRRAVSIKALGFDPPRNLLALTGWPAMCFDSR